MYDYVTTKPELNEEILAHYGIKGMKWRKKTQRLSDTLKEKRKRNYYARKMADDVLSGRRKYEPNTKDDSGIGRLSRNVRAKTTNYTWVYGTTKKDNGRKGQVQAITLTGRPNGIATKYTSKKAVDAELVKRKKRKK